MESLQDRNAGNQGDVWKHIVLLAIIRRLVEARELTSRFRYFESHAGKGEYSLEYSKEWRHGTRHVLASTPTTERDFYLDTEAKALAKATYLGSWRLVSEYFTHFNISHALELHDNDPTVVEFTRLTAANDPSIVVKMSDGFEAARDTTGRGTLPICSHATVAIPF
jgi:23S rRNA A2030 N6-methylase RlmJ